MDLPGHVQRADPKLGMWHLKGTPVRQITGTSTENSSGDSLVYSSVPPVSSILGCWSPAYRPDIKRRNFLVAAGKPDHFSKVLIMGSGRVGCCHGSPVPGISSLQPQDTAGREASGPVYTVRVTRRVYQGFEGDIRCKSVTNWYRLMRGLSISATCLLSILQATTLSPRSSPLAKFKPKSPQDSLRSLMFLWVFYMSFSAHFSVPVVDDSNGMSPNLMFLSDSCSMTHRSHFLRHLFTILGAFWDVILIGLMALSSGYMVALLCRHKRQCQHLHGTNLSPKASPEQRATRTILLLLGFFVLMYCLDCVISSLRTMWRNDPVCHCIQMTVANGYATVSPLAFICTKKQSVTLLKGLWQKNRQCLIVA
ncbi:vomeronasal type-1 receptor 90-like [Callospermophilus lateralis]